MKYRPLHPLSPRQLSDEVFAFWAQHKVFEKTSTEYRDAPPFTFYEGPPSANGMPGIHHVMARTLKDLFCRYKTMQGFCVERRAGWDTHGLPIELQVEKELGITKEDIGQKLSIRAYNEKCREAVMRYTEAWNTLTHKMGFWIEMERPYITYESPYIESVWWALQQLYAKDLLYKGYTIQPYSPAAGTALSQHELNQPGCYRMVKDTSVTAQFKVKNTEDTYLLAWTTTPWTLPANSALAIGEEIVYVQVRTFNPYTHLPIQVILAKDTLKTYFDPEGEHLPLATYAPAQRPIPYEIVRHMRGQALIGMCYEQLMPYIPLEAPGLQVVAADFVSTEEGSGIVHVSRTFGVDDYKLCVKKGIPGVFVQDEKGRQLPIVDKKGRFVQEITDFAGMYVKDYTRGSSDASPEASTDTQIALKLKKENKAFRIEKHEHSYPHCWRTDKPILYYPVDGWFIKTSAFRDALVAHNQKIRWHPPAIGEGRFGDWLSHVEDWNLSRSRFWGTPLPIWTSEAGEHRCIGSYQELREAVKEAVAGGLMGAPLPERFDPHRPFVDEIVLCSPTGLPMRRESDVIDVWFDSGAMPFAQWHYPFENKALCKKHFPADFIAEGIDQTRGWFFTLHVLAGMLFECPAFQHVVVNGLVLDKKGQKMSKRLGNAVDPMHVLDTYGADATRWYLMAHSSPWENIRFDADHLRMVQKSFFGTLENTYNFFVLYARIDRFQYSPQACIDPLQRRESDRWILSCLQALVDTVEQAYEAYTATPAARAIQSFVINDLSNWYVRLNRERFWKQGMEADKKMAFQTLYECLHVVVRLMAPLAPFVSEWLFRALEALSDAPTALSVHLTRFPKSSATWRHIELEESMRDAQRISSLLHALRKKHQVKVRQPLARALVLVPRPRHEKLKGMEALIKKEVNVKHLEYVHEQAAIVRKRVKPHFKRLGSRYGQLLPKIAQALSGLSVEEIKAIETSGEHILHLDNQAITLGKEDLQIVLEGMEGWQVASEGTLTVALDVTLSPLLQQEGLARELVNKLQNMRKEAGLSVEDKILLRLYGAEKAIEDAWATHHAYICREVQVQALHMHKASASSESKPLVVNGHALGVVMEKV